MRKTLIAGNWKMNLSYSQVPVYLEGLVSQAPVDILLAVPAPFLKHAHDTAKAMKKSVVIAAQTIHEKDEGAFTGEVSAPMLKDMGLSWTLIGHSERRQYYQESDASVALKTVQALKHGIAPIVCVGETRAEREAGQTESVLKRQLEAVLDVVPYHEKLVIAYEPVWAIGTGLTATDEQAQEAHAFIRSVLTRFYQAQAEQVRLLYGGSVKSSNIKGLILQKDVDGALVGGASLDPAEFSKIVLGAG